VSGRTPRLVFALLVALALASGCGRRTESESTEKEKKTEPGVVELQPGAMQRAGIVVGTASPAEIEVTVQLPGEVRPDSARMLVVRPRFAGVVHALRKQVGSSVHRGETIALVQSNESLTDYAITASMPGRVVSRGAAVGEVVTTDTPLYTIVDLSRVWVEFAVYPHQLGMIRQGQTVRIAPQGGPGPATTGTIGYVGPMLQNGTQVSVARVPLSNPGDRWQPGLFVAVTVVTDRAPARVALPDDAIVRLQDGAAVFIPDSTEENVFRMRRVLPGRSDGRMTEVGGIEPGTRVVVKNAFVLKAELEKSEYEEE
jgi:membrane fusion protein, heavy metal efflux system